MCDIRVKFLKRKNRNTSVCCLVIQFFFLLLLQCNKFSYHKERKKKDKNFMKFNQYETVREKEKRGEKIDITEIKTGTHLNFIL